MQPIPTKGEAPGECSGEIVLERQAIFEGFARPINMTICIQGLTVSLIDEVTEAPTRKGGVSLGAKAMCSLVEWFVNLGGW